MSNLLKDGVRVVVVIADGFSCACVCVGVRVVGEVKVVIEAVGVGRVAGIFVVCGRVFFHVFSFHFRHLQIKSF